MMDSDTGRSKGYGIVEYATIQDAENAIEVLRGTSIMGRTINVREDREDGRVVVNQAVSYIPPQSSYRHEESSGVIGKRIYVGNLSFDVTWQELKDLMKQG